MKREIRVYIMAKKHIWVYTVLVAIPLHVCPSANAQRTMDGQYFAQAECLWSGGTPGGSAAFGQYLLNSAWQAGAAMRSYSRAISTGDTLCVSDIVAFGEWDYRLLATRGRHFCLYAGGGVFLGYQMYDPWRTLPESVETGLGKGAFLYGIQANLRAEVFFCRRCALLISACTPIDIPSSAGVFHWEVSAGLRFNL